MLYQEFYIKKYHWQVYAFYDTTEDDIDDIMECLYSIGCGANTAIQAYDNIADNRLNTGLTFSKDRQSCIVLSRTSSREEFAHTFCHELHHCAMHIAKEHKIDPYSEEPAYIIGDLGKEMLPFASKFLCSCCSKKHKKQDDYERYDF